MSREAFPELVKALSDFKITSFTELQAAAYVALLQLGEETGSAIAQTSGINRSKIYDILNQLEEMGAVSKISVDGKVKYLPVSPETFLNSYLKDFESYITSTQEALKEISDLQEEVEPTKFTIRSISLDEIDANQFEYIISSSERSRTTFREKLDPNNRPGTQVKHLDLNDKSNARGMLLLLNRQEGYLFGTPLGKKVSTIHISSPAIAQFLCAIVETNWAQDLPQKVINEIEAGQRNALVIDKSLFMRFNQDVYERPVTFLLTDEHISFFYEGNEHPKLPLANLSNLQRLPTNQIKLTFQRADGGLIGELFMATVGDPLLLINQLQTLAPKI